MRLAKSLFSVALFIAVGLLAGIGAKTLYERWNRPAAVVQGDYSHLYGVIGAEVVLFGTSTCPYCKQARDFLDAHKIAYRDFVVDESSEAQRVFDALGEKGVPVLLAGNTLVRGYNSSEYAKIAARAQSFGRN